MSGKSNVVVDALSVRSTIDFEALAKSQEHDEKIKNLMQEVAFN